MLFNYTAEELQEIEQIKAKYAKMAATATSPDERAQISLQLSDELEAHYNKCQRFHFEKFGGNTDLILKNVKDQADILLEYEHNEIVKYSNNEDMLLFDLGEVRAGNFCFYKDFAENFLRNEFKLHLEALRNDDRSFRQIMAYITEAVKKCPFVIEKKDTSADFPGQLSLFDMPETKEKDHRQSGLKKAQMLGALTTIGGHITSISNKNFQFAFSSKVNKYAYMVNGGEALLQDIVNDTEENEEGLLAVTENNQKKLTKAAKENPIDSLLVKAFYSAALASEEAKESGTDPRDPDNRYMRVYLPKFCRELNIRLDKLDEKTAQGLKVEIFADNKDGTKQEQEVEVTEKKNNNGFWARYKEVQGYIGVLQEQGYYTFVSVALYDAATQIIYLDFPYFYGLSAAIKADKSRLVTSKRDKTKVLYEKHAYNKLLHSSITGTRNRTAAEIANLLINGVLQRGGAPDKKLRQNLKKNYPETAQKTVTYTVTCKTIVNSIPAFKYRLENMKVTDKGRDGKKRKKTRSETEKSILTQQNSALKTAFSGAYEIIRKQSDFYKAFKDANITEVIPTMRQLETTEIKITHKGINPGYSA